jgi:hypothetical protein
MLESICVCVCKYGCIGMYVYIIWIMYIYIYIYVWNVRRILLGKPSWLWLSGIQYVFMWRCWHRSASVNLFLHVYLFAAFFACLIYTNNGIQQVPFCR